MSYTIPEDWYGLSILEFAEKVGCADELLECMTYSRDHRERWDRLLDQMENGKVVKTHARATSMMGQACWHFDEIKIKMTHLPVSTFEEMSDTFRHEVAHLLALCARGDTNHDRFWKFWARKMGATPEARGADPVFAEASREAGPKRKVIARCSKCGAEWKGKRRADLSGRRHAGARLDRDNGERCDGNAYNVFDSLQEARRFDHYDYCSGWVGERWYRDFDEGK